MALDSGAGIFQGILMKLGISAVYYKFTDKKIYMYGNIIIIY
jgi:hypothetical protein